MAEWEPPWKVALLPGHVNGKVHLAVVLALHHPCLRQNVTQLLQAAASAAGQVQFALNKPGNQFGVCSLLQGDDAVWVGQFSDDDVSEAKDEEELCAMLVLPGLAATALWVGCFRSGPPVVLLCTWSEAKPLSTMAASRVVPSSAGDSVRGGVAAPPSALSVGRLEWRGRGMSDGEGDWEAVTLAPSFTCVCLEPKAGCCWVQRRQETGLGSAFCDCAMFEEVAKF